MQPIGYMTGEYPRVTDTFIQREVRALREMGLTVHTFAARSSTLGADIGPEQRAEAATTNYLLPMGPLTLLLSQLALMFGSPRRYLAAAALAWRTRAPGLRGHLWQLFYFIEAARLARWARTLGIGHLHNHFADSSSTITMLAAELGGITYSITIHGSAVWFNAERWSIGEKVKRARFIACISRHTRGLAMMFSDPEHWSRIHVVHCGVDAASYPSSDQTSPGNQITFVGRIASVKGLPVLFEAMTKLHQSHPEARLRLIGDGDGIEQLQALATQLGMGDRVEFVGPKSQDDVRSLLQTSQVVVLSSFAEGVPVVLMEAMASGVPVAGTDVGGTSELVQDQVSGFLVAPGDPEALAERLARLLSDGELRSRMGQAGRATIAADFSVDKEAARLHALLSGEAIGAAVRPTSTT